MKRSLPIFTAFLLFQISVGARPMAAQVTLDAGVKGGLSLARVSVAGFDRSWSTLARPSLGVFLSINLSHRFAIQPEVYWLTQGGSVRTTVISDPVPFLLESRHSLSYLHIPVLAKIHPVAGGAFRPVLFAGPAVDVLLSAVYRVYEDGVLMDEHNVRDSFKPTNFAVVGGAGLETRLDKVLLIFEARYCLGLADIYIPSSILFGEALPDHSHRTRALLFQVGVGF